MNIISQPTPDKPVRRHRFEGQSGVFEKDGAWVAIDKGRYAGEYRGKRGYLQATRAAGTTRRLS